jgi:thiamine biosynthesis lipoprotein
MPVVTLATMGTIASIRTDAPVPGAALADIRSHLDVLEQRFSLYRASSELSRVRDGAIALPDASGELRSTYARALEWRRVTDGAFTPHRPDGVVDLSGLVKADAIHAAGQVLDGALDRWLVTVGGDVLGRGEWKVGVVHPDDRTRYVTVVELGDARRAVATSGVAERGEHVWRSGPADFRQVTVAAADIVTADVLATAILAGGHATHENVLRDHPVEVLAL